jgi:hypothetical protein
MIDSYIVNFINKGGNEPAKIGVIL